LVPTLIPAAICRKPRLKLQDLIFLMPTRTLNNNNNNNNKIKRRKNPNRAVHEWVTLADAYSVLGK
jgi:hypothetical protein